MVNILQIKNPVLLIGLTIFVLVALLVLSRETFFKDTFFEEEITIFGGQQAIVGTLTTPDSCVNCPLVILITGSGQQTRDEVVSGFPVFKELAKNLGENTIKTFRYDDREGTVDEFSNDVVLIVNHFNDEKIGLLGHSEGGKTALLATEKSNEVDFVILMATSMMKQDELILLQQRVILEKEGKLSQENIEESLRLRKIMYDALKQRENVEDEVRDFVMFEFSLLPQSEQDAITQEQLDQGVIDFVNFLESNSFQFVLHYDPIGSVQKIDVPILAIYGEKDVQVPPQENIALLNNQSVGIVTVNNANHLFQSAGTGLPSEYAGLPKRFASGFISAIVEGVKND